jgi:mono/diheme cytochrome c family protein
MICIDRTGHASRIGRAAALLVPALALGAAAHLNAGTAPAVIFATKCSSCHTYGRGDLVGPDLKGVATRRSRPWLMSWIRSSERVIRSGDVTAVVLFEKYGHQRMPDHQLSDGDLSQLIDYLAAGGPEFDSRSAPRLAATANPHDVEAGRDLFFGQRVFASGGAACASCHSVQHQPALAGGSLGPDLTRTYSKYQDKDLRSLLEWDCLPRTPATDGRRPMTADESFAVRAFLRQADQQGRPIRRVTISEARSVNR